MDEEVSLDSAEEAERLVGWACKISLMDLQREIFLMIHAMKREQDQERLSFEGGFKFAYSEARTYFDITASAV